MFEPIRGGTRGGQGDFKWTDVSADKDRENYLGHSINAPTGRWQKNKDVHWYSRDLKDSEAERLEEIRKIKEAEADALAVALGFTPEPRSSSKPDTISSSFPSSLPPSGSPGDGDNPTPPTDPQRIIEKEEKRRRKEERRARREERRVRKESRKEGRRESKEEGRRWDRSRDVERGERGDRGRRYEDHHHQHNDEYNRRRHILPSDRRPSPSPTRLETRRRIERNRERARDSDSRTAAAAAPVLLVPVVAAAVPVDLIPLATPPAAAPISPQNEDVVNRGRGLHPERRR
ncbi:kinase phosphorylation protein-domain-containing protein [Lentinula edodes]|nr:kinase phosphorylation protein-domain-containing protein [Lentinula edodes]